MAAPAPAKPLRYKRLLNSVLHRRFVHAAAYSLASCYAASIAIGDKSSLLWSWFPLGPCGMRTAFLFAACLAVAVLRAGQMHASPRASTSPLADTRRAVFSSSSLNVFAVYALSAWVFGEVYRWSAPASAGLQWVLPGRPSERAHLNEAPIYLHAVYLVLAVLQTCHHLAVDAGRLDIHIATTAAAAATDKEQGLTKRTHAVTPAIDRVTGAIPDLLSHSLRTSVQACAAGPLLYTLLLRRRAWRLTLYFTRLAYSFSRSSSEPQGFLPPLRVLLSYRALASGFCLVALWQWTNLLVSVLLSQPPLRNSSPLTAGVKKNGNLSLVDGLKARQELVRTFAFWELALTSQDFPQRRQQIYTDLNNSAWKGVFEACTAVIGGVATRIKEFQTPPPPPPPPAQSQPQQQLAPADTSRTSVADNNDAPVSQQTKLMQEAEASIHKKAPSDKKVLLDAPKPRTRPERLEAALTSFGKTYGQARNDWTPRLKSRTQDLLGSAQKAILTPERNRRLFAEAQNIRRLAWAPDERDAPSSAAAASPQTTGGGGGGGGGDDDHAIPVSPLMVRFLRSRIGRAFQQPYRSRMLRVVFGAPHMDVIPCVDAVVALANLVVHSLQEDKYGVVQRDVAEIVRLFTQTIVLLQTFAAGEGKGALKPHWTDVDYAAESEPASQGGRTVREVEELLQALRTGLGEMLQAFRPHLTNVGLSAKDIKAACQAAGVSQI